MATDPKSARKGLSEMRDQLLAYFSQIIRERGKRSGDPSDVEHYAAEPSYPPLVGESRVLRAKVETDGNDLYVETSGGREDAGWQDEDFLKCMPIEDMLNVIEAFET